MSRWPNSLRTPGTRLFPVGKWWYLLFFFIEQVRPRLNVPDLCFKRIFQDLGGFFKGFEWKDEHWIKVFVWQPWSWKPRTSLGALSIGTLQNLPPCFDRFEKYSQHYLVNYSLPVSTCPFREHFFLVYKLLNFIELTGYELPKVRQSKVNDPASYLESLKLQAAKLQCRSRDSSWRCDL